MTYSEEKNITKEGKLAYEIYVKEIIKDSPTELFRDWWFYSNSEKFKKYYKLAKIRLRNEKIEKIKKILK